MILMTLIIIVPLVTGYENMAAYKETMELIQRYHEDMDQLGLDAVLTFASYHPAPLKVINSMKIAYPDINAVNCLKSLVIFLFL